MIKKTAKLLKGLSKAELEKKSNEIQTEIFSLKMKFTTGQLEDVAGIWRARKNLARVKTLLSQQIRKA